MSFVIDSNAPYFTEFPLKSAGDAVYMTAEDSVLGNVIAIVYRAHANNQKLSVILLGAHGTSGFVDMTLDRKSRFFGACRGLAPSHFNSLVRRALAIATLRTYATMDKPLRDRLKGFCDESAAGSLGSRFRLVYGKFPNAIGQRLIESGFISAKKIGTTVVDIIYEDSDSTIDQNNELVHILGEQLEQLFDPLSEYSPEPTERLYVPPAGPPEAINPHSMAGDSQSALDYRNSTLDQDANEIQDICEELYLLQAHARSDILDLLQTTLIPLRIEVLKGNFPNISVARLNSVFPPTIDELFRVNNIFYEALRAALPYGSFEVMKACGTSIPYFYRACMRHEAATQNFSQLLQELLEDEPDIAGFLPSNYHGGYGNIVSCSSHIMSIKAVLDRLNTALHRENYLSTEKTTQLEEFYSVATGTIDAFTNRENPNSVTAEQTYGNRKLGSAGRVLGEIAQGWPVELEYGWLNRRVVAIFDAVDILEPSDPLRQLHVVFILFTDYAVVCQPSEPIPVTSLSGLHIPFVGDMLMHAMLNDAPIDRNLPPLKVISWAPISDVHFASYAPQHLYVFSPGIVGSYRLMQPDSKADDLVKLLAKAKITMKTQPFHLFKLSGPEITVYSTVQEIASYKEEQSRTRVALLLSKEVTDRTLRKYDLNAAISLQISEDSKEEVIVNIVSRMRYNASFTTPKSGVRDLVVNELAYLMTLTLSSQNMAMLDVIIASNRLSSNRLIQWASEPGKRATHGHRKPNTVAPLKISGQPDTKDNDKKSETNTSAKPPRDSKSAEKTPINLSERSVESLAPVLTQALRKMPGKIPEKKRALTDPMFVDANEDFSAEQEGNANITELDRNISYSTFDTMGSQNTFETVSIGEPNSTWTSAEEEEQRDVDNWYHQLNKGYGDNESLNSDMADSEFTFGTVSNHSASNSATIQLGAFLDHTASNLYNQNAGRAFPRIESQDPNNHRRQITESSFETVATLHDISESSEDSYVSTLPTEHDGEDFSYLASLVDATVIDSKLDGDETTSVYPDLRESSLVRLGSYVLYKEPKHGRSGSTHTDLTHSRASSQSFANSFANSFAHSRGSSRSYRLSRDLSTDISRMRIEEVDEKTPTLHSQEFSAAAKERRDTTASESGVMRFPSPKKDKGIDYRPYANIESANWMPRAVRSGTNRTIGGHVYFPDLNDIGESSFDDDDGHELAQDWLRWSKMTRPVSILSVRTLLQPEDLEPESSNKSMTSPKKSLRFSKLPASQSGDSFRRMVMSSSLHTLQLASFTVQIDQKQRTSDEEVWKDLQRLRNYVTIIYKQTDITPASEVRIRTSLAALYQLMIKDNCHQIARELLEIEWVRRTRIVELGQLPVENLWRYD